MKRIIAIFLTMIFVTLSANAKEADNVIEKMIEAYGGEERVNQLNTYEQFWLVESKISDLNYSNYRMVIMPDYLRSKLRYPDRVEIRVLDKKNGTIMVDGAIFKAEGSALEFIKLDSMRLLSALELKKSIKELGFTSEDEYYIFSLTTGTVTAEYSVSKDSYFIEQVAAKIRVDSKDVEFKTVYEDFKLFNGVILPHKEVKFIDGVKSEVMSLKETRFSAPL